MRPELSLPIHNRVLDDRVGEGKLDYERTIRTAELLSLQDHETAQVNHEGTTFVITHQCQELKLKLLAHELSATIDALEARDAIMADRFLNRTRVILETLSTELAILETLSPRSYQEIRQTLGKGSGQESPGYNQLMVAMPLIWKGLEGCLTDAGVSLEQVYLNPEAHEHLFLLCESMATLDAKVQTWLHHHYLLVKRVIGMARDVKSLAANATTALASSMLKNFFDPLWNVRSEMTRDWAAGHSMAREAHAP